MSGPLDLRTPPDTRETAEYPVPDRATGEHLIVARSTADHAAVAPLDAGRGGRSARGVGLRLYGVASLEHAQASAASGAPLAAGTELAGFRDVAAIVESAPYSAEPLALPELDRYRAVIDEVFAQRTIVPAPPGTVFRSRDALTGWLELHYFTLVEALNFVEERAVARVTVARAPAGEAGARRPTPLRLAPGAEPEPDVVDVADDLVGMAATAFRALRKDAVAFLVLRADAQGAGGMAHGSFLVDRGRWAAFEHAVAREQAHHAGLRFRVTGPWPPYDFVRMQFRG